MSNNSMGIVASSAVCPGSGCTAGEVDQPTQRVNTEKGRGNGTSDMEKLLERRRGVSFSLRV